MRIGFRQLKKNAATIALLAWFILAAPAASLAQVAESTQTITQGENQGVMQGSDQGADQGTQAIFGENANTGAGSDNQIEANIDQNDTTKVNNTVIDTTNLDGSANTGSNKADNNTGDGTIKTGSGEIGVTQVKNDNTTVDGGTAGLNVTGHDGDLTGDLTLDFSDATANLNDGSSVRATNDTTGSDSTNDVDIDTKTEKINEVQNDGTIDNKLNLAAITGQNEASENTGDGKITTGDADVAATLVNLLNNTVINGNLWVTVADIFGSLTGNINIPDLASFLPTAGSTTVDAGNDSTGSDSTNTVDVNLLDRDKTNVSNDADINTIVNADAITGQNQTSDNTSGSLVNTGDASVSASNISLANTTIDGGNWGLFIVNSLNKWLGFLVGDNGQVKALSQEETIKQIEAQNGNTGSDSDNTISVNDEKNSTADIGNTAAINNEINAAAITGQNDASRNTGAGIIDSGDATVQANAVNIANTTVKNGSLFIAVVNIFGDWIGDLLYGGKSLAGTASNSVDIAANNEETGANSQNDVNVNIDRQHETNIDNQADVETVLNANVDTGNNRSNRNTLGADITTGLGSLALHAFNAANLTGIAGDGGIDVSVDSNNKATGFNSENTISANINNERIININNDANVSTSLGSLRQPALVNTGNNEASENTLGATISTGAILADATIRNLLNRIIVALGEQGIALDVNAANELTGAWSENSNHITLNDGTTIDITNDALVKNLINLLLNTGHNKANDNTGAVAIATGEICVEADITNDINRSDISGSNISLDEKNKSDVDNKGKVIANTGKNKEKRNTGGFIEAKRQLCKKVAVVPTVTPVPTVAPKPEEKKEEKEQKEEVSKEHEEVSAEEEVPGEKPEEAKKKPGRVAAAVTPEEFKGFPSVGLPVMPIVISALAIVPLVRIKKK